jgi:glycopeptide antibiotics resistance protein
MIWFAGLYARTRHAWIAIVVLALGLVLEFVQGRLSYRMFDVTDLLANALGVFTGFVLSFWFLAGWCQRLERQLFAGR